MPCAALGLQTNSLEVRRRILDLVRRLVSPETAGQVVGFLKKQLNKVEEEEAQGVPGSARYRSLLVEALSACCCLHPSVVPLCLGCLGDFLADTDAAVASSSALLLRRLAAKERSLRQPIVEHVIDSMRDARHSGSVAVAAAAALLLLLLLLLLLWGGLFSECADLLHLLLFVAAAADSFVNDRIECCCFCCFFVCCCCSCCSSSSSNDSRHRVSMCL
ncbi:hypothetical protein ACSSS7_003907 [Eimeria intestinalis]